MNRRVRTTVGVLAGALALTYASLLVPGRVTALCSHVTTPEYCPVLAYGFPLPFLADNQFVSPVGSVGRNPLWLFLGEDDLLWPRLGLSFGFWLALAASAVLAWRRWRRAAA